MTSDPSNEQSSSGSGLNVVADNENEEAVPPTLTMNEGVVTVVKAATVCVVTTTAVFSLFVNN